MMKLRFLKGRYRGRVVDIDAARGLTIGRASDNDLTLDEDGISRNHCTIYRDADAWWIKDNNSTNGVRVNGELIDQPRQLQTGDRIGLYNQAFIFADDASIVNLPPGQEDDAAADETANVGRMAPHGRATAEGADDAERDDTPVVHGFPWLHLLLLVGVIVAFVWFMLLVISSLSPDAPVDAPPVSREQPGEPVADAPPETPPVYAGEHDEAAVDLDRPDAAPPVESVAVTDEAVAVADAPPNGIDAVADTPPQPAPDEPAARPISVVVESEPPGAVVHLNDRRQGTTPLAIRDVAPGRHRLTLNLEGHEEIVRQIYNPGMLPDTPYVMRLRPGTVRLTSEPVGATLVHGTQIVGQTPLLISDMPPGQHEMRLVSHGYEPQNVAVDVSDIRGRHMHVQLAPLFGTLEIVTLPAGFEVYVDGYLKGVTRPVADVTPSRSQPFAVNGVRAGTRLVRVQHPAGPRREQQVDVETGDVASVAFRVWIPDTTLVLNTGAKRHGVLMSRNEHGDVILAEPGTRNYMSEQIQDVTPLPLDDVRQILREHAGQDGDGEDDARPRRRPPGGDGNTLQAPWELPEREPVRPPGDPQRMEGAQRPDDTIEVTADELTFLMQNETATEMSNRFNGKTIVLTGIPSSVSAHTLEAEIRFGPLIRCSMDRTAYDRLRGRIEQAERQKTPITLRGVAAPRAHAMLVRQCEFVEQQGE